MIDVKCKYQKPESNLLDFVESFWMLTNNSEQAQSVINLPDGKIDLLFYISSNEPFRVTLVGLDSEPSQNIIGPKIIMCAISFKLLAIEYVLGIKISSLFNNGSELPADFWGITADDLHDFNNFCIKVSAKIAGLLKDKEIDVRKQKLFEAIYLSNGSLTVEELSEQSYWSSRQINRYFNQQFGISLKKYCEILRFRASFQHIKEGKLFPEQGFFDQPHFIRDVKKFSGVKPKELTLNKNDRFIQFSTLPKK